MNKLQIISSGIVKNNPTFVLVLGMCPTLGTTTSAENGMGMGLATMAVLIMRSEERRVGKECRSRWSPYH